MRDGFPLEGSTPGWKVADVFFSYAREDSARARAIAEMLTRCGWTAWWDRKIPVGKTYSQVNEREIQAARCVLVLWSLHSVGSEWVHLEAAEGARRHVLIPVLLDTSKSLWSSAAFRQHR